MHPKTKITFIINPIAGTRQKEYIRQSISQRFSEEDADVIYTAYPGHAFEIASEKVKEGCRAVVAVGGDGTVNEVASALVHSDCRLGIIPVGSGNGLARHLRIPMHVPDALAVIENHKEQEIDAGEVNGRYFFCTCGTGFDASVGKNSPATAAGGC